LYKQSTFDGLQDFGLRKHFLGNPIVELKMKEVEKERCNQAYYFQIQICIKVLLLVEPRFNHEGGLNINGIRILEF